MCVMSSWFTLLVFIVIIYVLWKVLYYCLILPNLTYIKLRKNGFEGPTPRFPYGNINQILRMQDEITTSSSTSSSPSTINHNIHPVVFPHFSQWQKIYGKVYVYWLGTHPFLYVSDPEFLKEMATKVVTRRWGKPTIFQNDRHPMFGKGLSMVEGDDWVRHRRAISPSFSSSSLEAMLSLIVESTTKMLDHWSYLVSSGMPEIETEEELTKVTGEVIAKAGLGINYGNRIKLVKKIRALQFTLFSSTQYVGVPWGQFYDIKRTMKANRLGKDIDSLMLSSIHAQKSSSCSDTNLTLVGSLLAKQDDGTNDKKIFSVKELVDECKTMMFGGLDTTASILSWSLLLLALYPEWQTQLRDEIKEVIGDKQIDASMLSQLKKIGWVMNEVLRLYPTAPNAQRQAREEIKVYDMVIPKGTNIWIDITSMHHDPDIWRDDVNRFRPERFKDDSYGGAKYKMGYMPFGFGGRMCVGRSLATMEYKICLSLILTRFQITLSPNYHHSPATLLTLRPPKGLPLILQPFKM